MEQTIGLSGLRPMQPWFNRIETGLPRTKASLQSHNSSPTFNSQNIIITNHFELKYTYTNIISLENTSYARLCRVTAEEINTRLHTSRRLTPSSTRNMVSFRRVTASWGRIPFHGLAKRNREWPGWTICLVHTGHT
jgi:hypothetical protein